MPCSPKKKTKRETLLKADHPWITDGLDMVAVVDRIGSLHGLEDWIKECRIESCSLTSRARAAEEVVVCGLVRNMTNDFLGSSVGCRKRKRFRHDDPALGGNGAIGGIGTGNNWILVEPKASQTNISESLDKLKCHVAIRVNLNSRAFKSDHESIAPKRPADTVASDLVPYKIVDEGIPVAWPVDESWVDSGVNVEETRGRNLGR